MNDTNDGLLIRARATRGRRSLVLGLALLLGLPSGCSDCSDCETVGPHDTASDAFTAEDGPETSNSESDASESDTTYTEWTDCGAFDVSDPQSTAAGECLCNGVNECDAVWGSNWQPLGSERFRVCGKSQGTCRIAVFTETEGGGTGRLCHVPLEIAACGTSPITTQDLIAYCESTFSCNLLQENCPSELLPCG